MSNQERPRKVSKRAAESAGEGQKFVYRGIHAGHPALPVARLGVVVPGKLPSDVTPEQHNLGGVSADSPFTSWTYSYDEANRHATDRGGGGLILRLPKDQPGADAPWRWQDSPNEFDEDEVLLWGIRIGAEVVYGG